MTHRNHPFALIILMAACLLSACTGGSAASDAALYATETMLALMSTSTPIPPTPALVLDASGLQADQLKIEEVKTIETVGKKIQSIALSPDGATIAYGNSADPWIHLLNVERGEEVFLLLGHAAPVSVLTFSQDGALLASGNAPSSESEADGTVRVWNVRTGVQIALFNIPNVYNLAFSPNGKLLAAYVSLHKSVIVWDIATQTEVVSLEGFYGQMSFSPDSSLLAAGSQTNNQVHIYNLATGANMVLPEEHTAIVISTAFSPDGKLLASGSEDNNILIWDLASGQKKLALTGHLGGIEALAFNQKSSMLASLGTGVLWARSAEGKVSAFRVAEDRSVRFWDLTTGKWVGLIHSEKEIIAMTFSADWSVIATADMVGMIQIWKMNP